MFFTIRQSDEILDFVKVPDRIVNTFVWCIAEKETEKETKNEYKRNCRLLCNLCYVNYQ